MFNWLKRAFTKGQVTLTSAEGWKPIFESWGAQASPKIPASKQTLVNQFRSWVYVCASRNAQAVASTPLRLYAVKRSANERVLWHTHPITKQVREYFGRAPHLIKALGQGPEVVEVTEHPILDLLATVNPRQNGFDLLELTTTFLELTGDSYWLLDGNTAGQPARLYVLPSQYVIPKLGKTGEILGYKIGYGREEITYQPDEVLWFQYPSPLSQISGYGPGHAAYGASELQGKMETFQESTLDHHAVPPAMISPKIPLTKPQFDQLKKQWHDIYEGVSKAGKLGWATVPMEVQKLGEVLGDMVFSKHMEWSKREIAAVFGLPVAKIEMATSQEAAIQGDIQYGRDTIQPKCRKMEAKLNEKLVPLYDPSGRVFLAFDSPVPTDRLYELSRAQAMAGTSGIVRVNEVRVAFDLEPDPEIGDDLVEKLPGVVGYSPAPGVTGRNMAKSSVLQSKVNEKRQLRAILRNLFRQQRVAVLERLRSGTKDLDQARQDAFDLAAWVALFGEESRPFIIAALNAGAEAKLAELAAQTPIVGGWDIQNPKIQEFLRDYVYRFSFEVNSVTQRQLGEIFTGAVQEGADISEVADEVEGLFDGMERYRSVRIARTEIARAQSAGSLEAARQSGVVIGKRWRAHPTACEFCLALEAQYGEHGTPLGLDQAFAEQGTRINGTAGGVMIAEYGPVEYPPVHPSCICWLEDVLVGES